MKLVEVASGGGQPWTFDEIASDKPSVGAGGAKDQDKTAVNGHEKVTDVDGDEDEDDGGLHMDDKAVTVAENGAGGVPSPGDAAAGPIQEKPKLDPVHEVDPDMEVKIADLGNACWVVREQCNLLFETLL